jgi:hypothetical protein
MIINNISKKTLRDVMLTPSKLNKNIVSGTIAIDKAKLKVILSNQSISLSSFLKKIKVKIKPGINKT